MIDNFFCFKNDDKAGNQPDYRLSAKVNGEFVTIGAGWIKDKDGRKFISFSLQKPYNDKSGFVIKVEKGLKLKTIEYPDENISLSDVPF